MIDNVSLRSTIFKHLDGLVTAPIAFCLHKRGVLAHILDKKEICLSELSSQFKVNEGYLNVALRVLASQGFLDYYINTKTDLIAFRINEKSEIAFSLFSLYKDVVELLESSTDLRPKLFKRRFSIA